MGVFPCLIPAPGILRVLRIAVGANDASLGSLEPVSRSRPPSRGNSELVNGILFRSGLQMYDCVACSAERNEVLLCIISGLATQFPMVNLEVRHGAATLAPPSVPT